MLVCAIVKVKIFNKNLYKKLKMETASTTEALQKLKCFKCQNYLSIFPIYSDINQNALCGRCQPTGNKNFFHNDIYEISVEGFKFPCSYTSSGCREELFPKDLPNHEEQCEFRKIQCPALDLSTESVCNWQGFACDIYDHFEQKHSKFILQDGKFEADLISNYKGKFLYAFGQDYFIVTKSTNSVKNIVTCNVTYIGSDPNVKNYNFKITLKNANGAQKVDIIGKIGDTVQIDGKIIVDLLGDPFSILAELDVYEDTKSDNVCTKGGNPSVNYDIIEGLKCLHCSLYMLPPIYQCETGHSVCSDCKQKLKMCPTCNGKFNSTQNFALAQVIQHMIYPCMYESCNFSCKSKDIVKHEAACLFRPFTCPVKDSTFCNAKPIASKICEHLTEEHGDSVVLNDEISCILDEDEDIVVDYIIPYRKKLFLLNFIKESSNDLIWNMQLVNSDFDPENYKFEIDIQDSSGNNRRIYCRGNCTKISEIPPDMEVLLHYDQVKSYLKDDQLVYRVRIIEKN